MSDHERINHRLMHIEDRLDRLCCKVDHLLNLAGRIDANVELLVERVPPVTGIEVDPGTPTAR